MHKPTLVMDSEVYRNYYLLAFRNVATGNVKTFEAYDGVGFDVETIRKILSTYRIVTFNGQHYDLPVLAVALTGADCARMKETSDAIILNGFKYWQVEQRFNVKLPRVDHIDLIEVAPGKASLKAYGGRLHTPKMQDLPIEPDADITPEQRGELLTYCGNDLKLTQGLYEALLPQIELREKMSAIYGEDLRSKSDAQIAEAVIKSQLAKLTGSVPGKPDIPQGTTFRYVPPKFIGFTTPVLRETLSLLQSTVFVVGNGGKIMMPKALEERKIAIGKARYRMGMGGLHSCEQSTAHVAGGDEVIEDRDVASYYPSIILECGLYPKHLGPQFLKVYRELVVKRLAAKHSGDKVTADALKITINGSFGKFGSMWSTLYSPNLLIQTTVTGQLALLMLIEELERSGVAVVSANTDGIVMRYTKQQSHMVQAIVGWWELVTGFDTEGTCYSALYSRDVNNYIALKTSGGYKAKGTFTPPGFQKNPQNEICTAAVVALLAEGKPLAETITGCQDVRKFLTVRTVKGGAVKDDVYLGKAVRWYYATGVEGAIKYKINGYTVARSEGAMPCMDLPAALPGDIDYRWYIKEAQSMLSDLGVAQ